MSDIGSNTLALVKELTGTLIIVLFIVAVFTNFFDRK